MADFARNSIGGDRVAGVKLSENRNSANPEDLIGLIARGRATEVEAALAAKAALGPARNAGCKTACDIRNAPAANATFAPVAAALGRGDGEPVEMAEWALMTGGSRNPCMTGENIIVSRRCIYA